MAAGTDPRTGLIHFYPVDNLCDDYAQERSFLVDSFWSRTRNAFMKDVAIIPMKAFYALTVQEFGFHKAVS
jgi:hypothetical protein